MQIHPNTLDRQYLRYKEEYDKAAIRVLETGWYILGGFLDTFEHEFADYVVSKTCIGLNSGLDALILAIRALKIGPGDEVIVPANTYIATVLGVTENGATPVFVEPDEFYNIDPAKIEAAITKKTKAILCVHLYGQACRMDEIVYLAKKYHLYLLEDCAQSHGACFGEKMTGTFGDMGCFSFYPTKNLGAFGDSGAIVTDKEELADKIMMLRNYGSKVKYQNEIEGVNSRMDEMQAALLSVKLFHMKELTKERKYLAERYLQGIQNEHILLPQTAPEAEHVYHQFVIYTENRDGLQTYLGQHGIGTQIHYPIPPHLAKCYAYLGYREGDFPITERYARHILSLPIYNGMTKEEQEYVIDILNRYTGE